MKHSRKMAHRTIVRPYLIKIIPLNPPKSKSLNLYMFDLDHTLIEPRTVGSSFSRGPTDWKFMKYNDMTTADFLMKLLKDDENAQILVLTNQGAVLSHPPTSKSCLNFQQKINFILRDLKAMLGEQVSDRFWFYAATKVPASLKSKKYKASNRIFKKGADPKSSSAFLTDDLVKNFEVMRKPETGMMVEFQQDLKEIYSLDLELNIKYYCGDAAGRPGDFSDSDKLLAQHLNIEFKIPEEVFRETDREV